MAAPKSKGTPAAAFFADRSFHHYERQPIPVVRDALSVEALSTREAAKARSADPGMDALYKLFAAEEAAKMLYAALIAIDDHEGATFANLKAHQIAERIAARKGR